MRKLVTGCFDRARLSVGEIILPSSTCVIESKMLLEMTRVGQRNEYLVQSICREVSRKELNTLDVIADFLDLFFMRRCWYSIVCLMVIIDKIVENEFKFLNQLNMHENDHGYEMDPAYIQRTARYVDNATWLWVEEANWYSGFLNKFESRHPWVEKLIFNTFLSKLREPTR